MFRYVTMTRCVHSRDVSDAIPTQKSQARGVLVQSCCFSFYDIKLYATSLCFPDNEDEAEGLLLAFHSSSLSEWGAGRKLHTTLQLDRH